MYFKQEIGMIGEEMACKYLIKNNYKIIDRNFSCNQGEIDIIALSSHKELVFIEVKTRKSLKYGTPSEAITKAKKRHIISSAKYYIYLNKIKNIDIRFDVIEIFIHNSKFMFNHIKQAF